MIYVLILLVVFSVAFVVYLNVAQRGELIQQGAPSPLPLSTLLKPISTTQIAVCFYTQDETPQCIEVVRAFQALTLPAGMRRVFIAVASQTDCDSYASKHNISVPVIADANGAAAKACGVLINTGFMKLAKKTVIVIDNNERVQLAKLVPEGKDVNALGLYV
jgi:peroxiredoxin